MTDETDNDRSPPLLCSEGTRPLHVLELGTVDYGLGLELQRRIAAAVINGEISDTLLLLEHPPVLTVGRGGKERNILVSHRILRREGVQFFEVDRGGDVTYHGPGQMVGYPILDLRRHGRDIHRYIRTVEEAIIRTLKDLGISACRREGLVGVWVGDEKIASIGVNVRKWVTTHGFAFNITTDLEHFRLINPCGLPGVRMTSVAKLLGRNPGDAMVRGRLAHHFRCLLGIDPGCETTLPPLLLEFVKEAGAQPVEHSAQGA
jgi:lipoate-protein ligase B